MRQQYGLRIKSDEFEDMDWQEFTDLLAGLNDQTPLVKVARIRTETDPEALKDFTPEQRRMRSEWQRRRALARPKHETESFIATMQRTMSALFGGERT